MGASFIPRQVKSSWGIPSNQNAEGELYVGKGWGTPFGTQFPSEITTRVTRCLNQNRGDRNGRFWVNLKKETVTMMVGDSAANQTLEAKF
ncbi:MAG TPA: hypothetical protein VN176_17660 [Verrucomicrobiae bacterium]|jgi:hypothetical protein|nr:hypothetical protein [Verrucomicrobiae bacterium]